MFTPEEKLQRQAAIARSQNQKGRRSSVSALALFQQPNDTNATIISYNADIGQNIIQGSDGSITYAVSDTNGAMALGESVPRNGGTGNIDGLPNYKKQLVVAKKAIQKRGGYSFWMLAGQYILQWDVAKDVATLSVITKSLGFPPPHNKFHNSNFGLSRINKNEFLMPQFGSLSKYNIANNTAVDTIGQIDSFAIQNPHACYTLPTGESLVSVEMRDTAQTRSSAEGSFPPQNSRGCSFDSILSL